MIEKNRAPNFPVNLRRKVLRAPAVAVTQPKDALVWTKLPSLGALQSNRFLSDASMTVIVTIKWPGFR